MFYTRCIILTFCALTYCMPSLVYAKLFNNKPLISHTAETSKKTTPSSIVTPQVHGQYDWTFIVYIAGNNNLYKFIADNMAQMAQISSKRIAIAVYLDSFLEEKIRHVFITKGKQTVIQEFNPTLNSVSGTKESFYKCLEWALTSYKAKHHAVVLWNHGTGALEPNLWGRVVATNRDKLFEHNEETNMWDLQRNDLIGTHENTLAVGINDNYHQYLTNSEVAVVLEQAKKNFLQNKKIDIIGMDACHMAMIEVCSELKEVANYLVASQEVIWGPGWDYTRVLKPFEQKNLLPDEFAKHIVNAYKKTYLPLTYDFTLSAINLSKTVDLEQNLDQLGKQLVAMLTKQTKRGTLFTTLKKIRTNSALSTWFYDNNYIDLQHMYMSLLNQLKALQKSSSKKPYQEIIKTLNAGLLVLHTMIAANTNGAYLPRAAGVSIYWPTKYMHSSYKKSTFGKSNHWSDFISRYTNNIF